jgi:hypothetical protein
VEQGYQPPAYSEAQLAEFARHQLRLLAPTARNYAAAEEREVRAPLKALCCPCRVLGPEALLAV